MKRGLVKQNLNLVGMLLKRGKECSYLQTFIFVKRNYNKKSIKKNEMTWKLKKKKKVTRQKIKNPHTRPL